MKERRQGDRRKNPIDRCPKQFKDQFAYASVQMLLKRVIEQRERKEDARN